MTGTFILARISSFLRLFTKIGCPILFFLCSAETEQRSNSSGSDQAECDANERTRQFKADRRANDTKYLRNVIMYDSSLLPDFGSNYANENACDKQQAEQELRKSDGKDGNEQQTVKVTQTNQRHVDSALNNAQSDSVENGVKQCEITIANERDVKRHLDHSSDMDGERNNESKQTDHGNVLQYLLRNERQQEPSQYLRSFADSDDEEFSRNNSFGGDDDDDSEEMERLRQEQEISFKAKLTAFENLTKREEEEAKAVKSPSAKKQIRDKQSSSRPANPPPAIDHSPKIDPKIIRPVAKAEHEPLLRTPDKREVTKFSEESYPEIDENDIHLRIQKLQFERQQALQHETHTKVSRCR